MNKFLLLSATCCLLFQSVAFADPDEPAPAGAKPSVEDELSERLDTFFHEAIDGGLLQKGGASHTDDQSKPQGHKPAVKIKKSRLPKCVVDDSLDFSDLSDLTRYSDLLDHVEKIEADMKAGSVEAGTAVAKGYLALGLYAESRLLLKKLPNNKSKPLLQLADLLEQNIAPNVSFFRSHAVCNRDSSIWLSAALLTQGAPEGAAILAKNQTRFRGLPLQLRIDVTATAIPELDRFGDQALARILIASFTAEEAAGASRLQFSLALMEAGEGIVPVEDLMREYMLKPKYRATAAAAMLRYGQPISAEDRDALLEELISDLSHADGGKDIAVKLRVALQQMSALSDYSQLSDLEGLPGLQSPAVLGELRRQLVFALQGDMASEEPARVLEVIEVLLSHKDLLSGDAALESLYETSVGFANDQGYLSLANEMGRRYGVDNALLAADLAYRGKDKATLYSLAERHLDNAQILLWAALTAIEHNDASRIQTLQSHLSLNAETVVPLIEADALSGNWIVPYAFYVAASELKPGNDSKKIQQILDLRQRERTGRERVRQTGISHASEVLENSAASLSTFNGETTQ